MSFHATIVYRLWLSQIGPRYRTLCLRKAATVSPDLYVFVLLWGSRVSTRFVIHLKLLLMRLHRALILLFHHLPHGEDCMVGTRAYQLHFADIFYWIIYPTLTQNPRYSQINNPNNGEKLIGIDLNLFQNRFRKYIILIPQYWNIADCSYSLPRNIRAFTFYPVYIMACDGWRH